MPIIEEFKKFAIKGNVIDMGVGIIIGTAFGKIVTSLVNDILMPPIGLFLGGVDFTDKVIVLKRATEEASAITLNYGAFLSVVLNFLIIALAMFIVIKQMNRLHHRDPEKEEKPIPVAKDIQLLTEIRDELRKS